MKVNGCCCFTLKTGCIIISLYYMIVSLQLLISSSMVLYDELITDKADFKNDDDGNMKDPVIRGILWAFLVAICLRLIMSCVLLVGAMKEIPALVFVWFIANTILLVAIVSGMSVRLFLDPRNLISWIGKIIYTIIFGVYFLIVAKSFHTDLKKIQDNNAEPV